MLSEASLFLIKPVWSEWISSGVTVSILVFIAFVMIFRSVLFIEGKIWPTIGPDFLDFYFVLLIKSRPDLTEGLCIIIPPCYLVVPQSTLKQLESHIPYATNCHTASCYAVQHPHLVAT
jgi:hypothetical protein